MAWNDDHTGADWTATSFLDMFEAAIWEREKAASYDASPGSPATCSAGTDVQIASFLSGLQARIEALLTAGVYFDGTPVIDGVDITSYNGQLTAADLPEILNVFQSPAQGFAAASIGGWMRKRPREIATTASLFDTQGNIRADGDVARCLADGLVYQFVGHPTYEWQPASAAPDLLVGEAGDERVIDDTSATEDQVGHPAEPGQHARSYADSQVYVYVDSVGWVEDEEDPDALPDRVTTGAGVIFGRVQAGDYLGAWIFNQMRDILNLLTVSFESIGSATPVSLTRADGGSTLQSTEAAAYAAAIAPWDPGVDNATLAYLGSPGGSNFQHSYMSGTWSGGVFQGFLCGVASKKASVELLSTPHRDRTVYLFAAFSKATNADPGNPDFTWTYDTQTFAGAPATESLKIFTSVPLLAGTASTGAKSLSFDPDDIPPNYADIDTGTLPSASSKLEYVSWMTAAFGAAIEWDFTYA